MTIFGHQTFIELQIKAKSQRLESGNKGLETLFMTTKIFPRAFKLDRSEFAKDCLLF